MSDGDGFNNNLVEYNMLHVGLIAKAQSFIIDCVGYLRTQENQRFSASTTLIKSLTVSLVHNQFYRR